MGWQNRVMLSSDVLKPGGDFHSDKMHRRIDRYQVKQLTFSGPGSQHTPDDHTNLETFT